MKKKEYKFPKAKVVKLQEECHLCGTSNLYTEDNDEDGSGNGTYEDEF